MCECEGEGLRPRQNMQKLSCSRHLASLACVNGTCTDISGWQENAASADVTVIKLAHTLPSIHPRLLLPFNPIISRGLRQLENMWTPTLKETASPAAVLPPNWTHLWTRRQTWTSIFLTVYVSEGVLSLSSVPQLNASHLHHFSLAASPWFCCLVSACRMLVQDLLPLLPLNSLQVFSICPDICLRCLF